MKVNEEINDLYHLVRVVGVSDEFDGEMGSLRALKHAKSIGMDLVCVNEKPNIPICKIYNVKKKQFESNKKKKNTKPAKTKLKTIQLGLDISDNDISYRIKNAIKFIEKKNQVKISLLIKGGRNMARGTAQGASIIQDFVDKINQNDLTWNAEFTSQPKLGGNTWTAIIVGKKKKSIKEQKQKNYEKSED